MMTSYATSYSNDYRFGFNGQEKDNEVKQIGNSLDFGNRIYDSRLGKFLSLDPLQAKYPWNSPYAFAVNKPISGIDLNGLEYYYTADGKLLGKHGKSKDIRIVNYDFVNSITTDKYYNIGMKKFFAEKTDKDASDWWTASLEDNSVPAYRQSKKNELSVLKSWAVEYQNNEREYGMSLYSRNIDNPDGDGQFRVFIEGTVATGEDYEQGNRATCPIGLSKVPEGLNFGGWTRFTTIHTHPNGTSRNFSNEYGAINQGADMQFGTKYMVDVYLVPPQGSYMGLFSPSNYADYLRKYDEEGYLKGQSDKKIAQDNNPASPHNERQAENSVETIKFK